MDNCVRENKNKYVFGFLAMLVEMNIFTEVRKTFQLNYCMKCMCIEINFSQCFKTIKVGMRHSFGTRKRMPNHFNNF